MIAEQMLLRVREGGVEDIIGICVKSTVNYMDCPETRHYTGFLGNQLKFMNDVESSPMENIRLTVSKFNNLLKCLVK